MRRDFPSASPLLVFQVIIDGRYDAHRLYIGRIGVPVGDRELSLVGKFDLSQFAFRIVREFFAGDAGVLGRFFDHFRFDLVQRSGSVQELRCETVIPAGDGYACFSRSLWRDISLTTRSTLSVVTVNTLVTL